MTLPKNLATTLAEAPRVHALAWGAPGVSLAGL